MRGAMAWAARPNRRPPSKSNRLNMSSTIRAVSGELFMVITGREDRSQIYTVAIRVDVNRLRTLPGSERTQHAHGITHVVRTNISLDANVVPSILCVQSRGCISQ